MSKAHKKLLILGALNSVTKGAIEDSGYELFESEDIDDLKAEAVKANCMMDIPDYLKDYKPKGRSKADRKRNPRWPRR